MGFYLSECMSELRGLLNDTDSTAYRYDTTRIEDYARSAVREISSLRPDLLIDEYGAWQRYTDIYSYTESAQSAVLDEFQRITGWDKYSYPVLYLTATSGSVITAYPTDADRTATTNSMATISGCDSVGVKTVAEANSSGIAGVVKVTYPATSGEDWNITVTETELFDDSVRMAFIYYIIYLCFLADSEDVGDSNRSAQYMQLFQKAVGV